MSWFFYNLIGLLFRLGLKFFFEVKVEGLENYSESPSTLIVANHKRDLDSVLIATVFYYHEGFLNPGKPVSFMGAENLFQPGFLSEWIRGPQFLKKALRSFSLDAILKGLHAYPIAQLDFHSVPLHDALNTIKKKKGDLPLRKVLEGDALHKLIVEETDDGVETIEDFFRQRGYSREKVDSRNFKNSYRKLIKKDKLKTVRKQLGRFTDLLEDGGVLYITPEGKLSEDGLLGSLKDSLLILIDKTDRSIKTVPTNITYDFLTTAKSRIFLHIGEERTNLEELSRKERSKELRESILSLTTVTMSQLGSVQLLRAKEEGRKRFSRDAFFEGVEELSRYLVSQDLYLDQGLRDYDDMRRRGDNFIAYCCRKGILDEEGQKLLLNSKFVLEEEDVDRGYRRDPIRYCANELRALDEIGLIELSL